MIYLIAVSGVMIELHYCGQELASWQLFAENDGCNSDACSDEPSDDGCCKDELVVAKVNDDQNVAQQLVLKVLAIDYLAQLPQGLLLPERIQGNNTVTVAYSSNAPPGLWQDIPLYKLNSNYIYYG